MADFSQSYVYQRNVSPQTASAISSRHKIFAFAAGGGSAKLQVGVVGTFDPSHGRGVDPVRGIGFGDQIAELVPTVSDPVTISVSRTLLYLSNIFQVFGYIAGAQGIVRDLKHHKWPFDIESQLVMSEVAQNSGKLATEFQGVVATAATKPNKDLGEAQSAGAAGLVAIITQYIGCWMTSYSTSYPSDSSIVTETVDISVTDTLAGGGRVGVEINTGNSLLAAGASALFKEDTSLPTV